ncbi:glucose-6-phosphate isomerase [Wenzhouxiangella sp. AB-CW3]|uniref:glucose-6-phosphate isomerase n=1 Tax=Wenzhouxiangella sp. AB-CW3 TaxID=2771012 RepID=UPI00168A6CF0|nr:glucose-6-phosphate isomerase [Wenzhouxiangella sp. AB-CW3]QOC23152.1 glucose-6-phosphate isomerase [Wenzhouxiangella sp. AB-CW3]
MLQKNDTPGIAELFESDPGREQDFRLRQSDWELDYSRIPLERAGLTSLHTLTESAGLGAAVARLFAGESVNTSERQPALHMALRAEEGSSFGPGADMATLLRQRQRFMDLAARLHDGSSGLTDLLHIGIGGSDLGPRLVADALNADDSAVRVHWLSTLDGRRFERLCRELDPATTGMVMASKSFSTEETMTQARAARQWLGEGWAKRAWAATANAGRAEEFGVPADHVLEFPSFVGGRYSLWSSVGVSAAARIGPERFRRLLAGAERADREFARSEQDPSMAVVLALLMHYLRRDLDLNTLGVVSYEPRLALLAGHLQQLVMESLGKGVDLDDRPLDVPTAPLIYGGRGTDLQHSIFQALHQGRDTHPLLLVGSLRDRHAYPEWHQAQYAHLLAQARAFANGRSDGEIYQNMPGNRPVATLIVDELDSDNLGWLLASLEHAVYALSVLWGINAFDQWGVEEGKRLAAEIRSRLQSGT